MHQKVGIEGRKERRIRVGGGGAAENVLCGWVRAGKQERMDVEAEDVLGLKIVPVGMEARADLSARLLHSCLPVSAGNKGIGIEKWRRGMEK